MDTYPGTCSWTMLLHNTTTVWISLSEIGLFSWSDNHSDLYHEYFQVQVLHNQEFNQHRVEHVWCLGFESLTGCRK